MTIGKGGVETDHVAVPQVAETREGMREPDKELWRMKDAVIEALGKVTGNET